jgi:ribosome-associated translation inhibitor RaiA
MNVPSDRAEINRQNAAHSRGPITPEGKRRVSLNALRHGLTGHTVVLPSEDLAAYQKHCGEFHTELKPQCLIESKCVQTIADTYWRLDRIRAMENSLFGLAVSQETETETSSDTLLHSALAQAKALEHHSDLLTRLSLYEHRLNRTLEKAKAELKQSQKERAEAHEKALIKAAEIAELKEALHQPWDPRDDGFEFSSGDLTAWRRRIELTNDADMYRRNGFLASRAPRSDKKGAPNGPAGRQRT